jgi:hypothetical protein
LQNDSAEEAGGEPLQKNSTMLTVETETPGLDQGTGRNFILKEVIETETTQGGLKIYK